MTLPKNKCKGCVEKRKQYLDQGINCHSVCEDYLEFKRQLEEINKNRRDESYRNYLCSSARKRRKR